MQLWTNPFASGMSADQRVGALFDPAGVFGNKAGSSYLGESRNEKNAAGIDTGNPFDIPDYVSALGDNNQLQDKYKLMARPDVGFASSLGDIQSRLDAAKYDPAALNELTKEALDTSGNSAWETLSKQKQALDEQDARNRAVEQGRSATSSAFSDLASKGGLSNGARERLARTGALSYNQSLQDINRSGMEARADIGTQAEQNRLALLSAAPGAQAQASQVGNQSADIFGKYAEGEDQRQQDLNLANRNYATNVDSTNLTNTLNQLGGLNDYNLGKYQSQMQTYAAQQQAKATAAAGGGGKGGGK